MNPPYSVLVTCVRCRRLHPVVRLNESNPLCPGCAPASRSARKKRAPRRPPPLVTGD